MASQQSSIGFLMERKSSSLLASELRPAATTLLACQCPARLGHMRRMPCAREPLHGLTRALGMLHEDDNAGCWAQFDFVLCQVEAVVGVHNNAKETVNVTGIAGSLNNAAAFAQHFQNFSYMVHRGWLTRPVHYHPSPVPPKYAMRRALLGPHAPLK